VHDWSARLPSASFAFILISLIYLHIRRFSAPGGQLDAALITAELRRHYRLRRAALRPDMQLAAPFLHSACSAGMRGTRRIRSFLALRSVLLQWAQPTLAKGPVAPFLPPRLAIIFAFHRRLRP